MDTNERLQSNLSLREKTLFAFGIIMSIVYLCIGLAALLLPSFLADYNSFLKIGIGSLCVAYSFFRFYRSYLKYKDLHE